MTPRELALRAQDIQTSLQGFAALPARIEMELDATQLAGMASRLATHIRGADVFGEDEMPRLRYVASSLGIPSTSFSSVLEVLQEAELVQVRRSAGAIKEVRESVPAYGDLYTAVGTVYESKYRTEVEDALVSSFSRLVESPKLDDGSLPVQTLDADFQTLLLDVTGSAGLIRVTDVPKSGQRLFYTPQYWDENHDKMALAVAKHGDERVRALVKQVSQHQGLPFTRNTSRSEDEQLLRQLADIGVLPSPTVSGNNGDVAFAFTPFRNSGADPAVTAKILEKTRAILACVRYGEGFATVTTIRSPLALLNALKTRGRLKPHSETYNQYRLLLEQGVCRLARSTTFTDRHALHFIDTEENKIALDAAIDILTDGNPFSATHVEQDVTSYALNGQYTEPPTARARQAYVATPDALEAMRTDLIELFLTQ